MTPQEPLWPFNNLSRKNREDSLGICIKTIFITTPVPYRMIFDPWGHPYSASGIKFKGWKVNILIYSRCLASRESNKTKVASVFERPCKIIFGKLTKNLYLFLFIVVFIRLYLNFLCNGKSKQSFKILGQQDKYEEGDLEREYKGY